MERQRCLSGTARNKISDANRDATGVQKDMYETTRTDNEPWRAAGQAALKNLTDLLDSGQLSSRFAGKLDNEPGYDFARKEGMKAIDSRMSARGGNGIKAGAEYVTGLANQHYNDAFNRWNTENTGTYNRLSNMAGLGQAAVNQVTGSGQNAATQTGANYINLGNSLAGSAINQGNIYANALNQGLGYYNNQNWWQGGGQKKVMPDGTVVYTGGP